MTAIEIKGKTFLVDPEYVDQVNQFNWCLDRGDYAHTTLREGLSCTGQAENMRLHQLITYLRYDIPLGDKTYTELGFDIDHINKDVKDNRKINLRFLNKSLNCSNKKAKGTSKYHGVHFYKRTGQWQAYYYHQHKRRHLGFFKTELEAAAAYNSKIKELGLTDQRVMNQI